jgi:hypothetical protein
MSAKQLQAIALGLAVLLVLWGAGELLSRGPDTTTGSLRLPALAASDVDSVVITHGADTVLLVKQSATAWTVNRFPASLSSLGDLFQALRDSVKPELAAENPSSFARMGVDSAGGRLLRLTGSGKTLALLIVGGHGPQFDASYVRLPGDAHIYLWRGRLPGLVGRSVDDWRDHQIGAVAPDSITAVEIQRAGRRYVLRKQGARWLLSGGAADSAAVAQLLDRFRNVNATGFATEGQADSLRVAQARRRVAVRGAGGRELLTLAFDSTGGGYWARHPSGGPAYRLDFWQVDQLTPTEGSLEATKR